MKGISELESEILFIILSEPYKSPNSPTTAALYSSYSIPFKEVGI